MFHLATEVCRPALLGPSPFVFVGRHQRDDLEQPLVKVRLDGVIVREVVRARPVLRLGHANGEISLAMAKLHASLIRLDFDGVIFTPFRVRRRLIAENVLMVQIDKHSIQALVEILRVRKCEPAGFLREAAIAFALGVHALTLSRSAAIGARSQYLRALPWSAEPAIGRSGCRPKVPERAAGSTIWRSP